MTDVLVMSQSSKFQMVRVSGEENVNKMGKYLKKNGYEFPKGIDRSNISD